MKSYLVTTNALIWELHHSQYAKVQKSKEFFRGIGNSGFFLGSSTFVVVVKLKMGDTFSSTIPFVVAIVVLTLISCLIIIRFRTAIHRWKRSVVIDRALQTINLYGTHSPLVQVSLVELSVTEMFPFERLLLKTSSADHVLLDARYDWYNEAEWTDIGSLLATFLGVSFNIKYESIVLGD
ncbi:MAG: hypothetical protein ACRYFS_25640 [Janthinobacterium lividum]